MVINISNQLRNDILKLIKPSKLDLEKLNKIIFKTIKRLKLSARKLGFDCDFFIGGSFGKGTFLKTSSDIDIFVRFNIKYDNNEISYMLEQILINANIKFKKQKGSRDYYSYNYNFNSIKLVFEFIPNRKIKNINQVLNSTDLSPLHVLFIKQKIKENPNLADEIRITKQFFKSKFLYGAESYIHGFSGHSIDILVSYYGSFENFLKALSNWKEQTIIDINNFYKNDKEILEILDFNKQSNLILIDPIIKQRNAAKALSSQMYAKAILEANQIKSLSMNDFIVKKPNFKSTILEVKQFSKKNNLKFLIYKIHFKNFFSSEDIIGSKLLKLEKKLKQYFQSLDFQIFLDDFYIDMNSGNCLLIFLFEKIKLPQIKKIIGPKVFMREQVDNFLKKNDNYFIENLRVCIYEPRIIYKLEIVSKLKKEDFFKILGKDISFITSIRRIYK